MHWRYTAIGATVFAGIAALLWLIGAYVAPIALPAVAEYVPAFRDPLEASRGADGVFFTLCQGLTTTVIALSVCLVVGSTLTILEVIGALIVEVHRERAR